jgi:hypothetical protein
VFLDEERSRGEPKISATAIPQNFFRPEIRHLPKWRHDCDRQTVTWQSRYQEP